MIRKLSICQRRMLAAFRMGVAPEKINRHKIKQVLIVKKDTKSDDKEYLLLAITTYGVYEIWMSECSNTSHDIIIYPKINSIDLLIDKLYYDKLELVSIYDTEGYLVKEY